MFRGLYRLNPVQEICHIIVLNNTLQTNEITIAMSTNIFSLFPRGRENSDSSCSLRTALKLGNKYIGSICSAGHLDMQTDTNRKSVILSHELCRLIAKNLSFRLSVSTGALRQDKLECRQDPLFICD